jgi:ParB-like nuclease family protein
MRGNIAQLPGAGPACPWPADRVERWPIEWLIPYAGNARVHTEADLEKIAAAIRRWGWTMPALVDEEGVLIVGHGRVAAAPRAGVTSIPVIVARGWSELADPSSWSSLRNKSADNQLAARASWDLGSALSRSASTTSSTVWDRAV